MSSYITRHQLYNNVINISQTPLQTVIKATRIPSLFTALCYLRLEMEQPNIKHTLSSVAKKQLQLSLGILKPNQLKQTDQYSQETRFSQNG